MKYTVTKVTTTSTSTTGGKLKTTSQGYSQNQQKKVLEDLQ